MLYYLYGFRHYVSYLKRHNVAYVNNTTTIFKFFSHLCLLLFGTVFVVCVYMCVRDIHVSVGAHTPWHVGGGQKITFLPCFRGSLVCAGPSIAELNIPGRLTLVFWASSHLTVRVLGSGLERWLSC